MARILVKGGRVWDGARFFMADVLTENQCIAKVEPGISEPADFTFDASGKTVSCGLVDAHVHMLGISGPEFGIDATMSTLPFGVTAAADASGSMGDEALLDSFLVKSCVFADVPIRNDCVLFDSALERLARFGKHAVGFKVYFDVTVSDVRSVAPLKAIVAEARRRNLIVMVHSSHPPVSMPELLGALGPGDILTHTYHGGKYNVSEDHYASLREARARGVVIDAGFAGHIHTDFNIFTSALHNNAAPQLISTDITRYSAYKRGGSYGLPMCMSLARTLGMAEEAIFTAVTSAPARALGRDNEWGRLTVGRCADLCVLEYADAPFDLTDAAGNRACSQQGYRNVLTIANGEVIYRR